ncbi:MAG: hypothetical protein CL868_06175 [Cytophagaceae bacterium]|nr:hypothetical protein [Cytophagaceae bacterium]|tara:strand:- start:477 stop:1259 length:783 start_codon:yes stop_codon:yes gene_type:complete
MLGKKIRHIIILVGTFYISQSIKAQFTPPGLGEIHTGEWFAVGFKQNLDDSHQVTNSTYMGMGRSSRPDDYNPGERASIYVVNEEISNHFAKHWKYSGALSYRWQDRYSEIPPYAKDSPDARQEIRTYGKLSYQIGSHTLEFSSTYRPELRFFFDPYFKRFEETMQFRSRFKEKLSWSLDHALRKKLLLSTELLFATEKQEHWDKWRYKESRFCLYFSYTNPSNKMVFDVGYMNELLGKTFRKDIHYIAFDVILKNPFTI